MPACPALVGAGCKRHAAVWLGRPFLRPSGFGLRLSMAGVCPWFSACALAWLQQKQAKAKRKRESKRTKFTNAHLPELFQEYTPAK